MLETDDRFFTIEMVLTVEVALILMIVFSICVLHFISSFRAAKNKRTDKLLREVLIRGITENKLPVKEEMAPYLYSLSVVTQVIRELNGKIKGATWRKGKELILKEWMGGEINRALYSRSWKKRSWSLQALALFPNPGIEERVIALIKDKIPAVRFSAANCLIKMKSQNGINELLQAMSEEETYARYPFRDLLVTGDAEVFTYIANQYRESENLNVRICALEVLSQKIGFINADLVRKDLESENSELKWWALRALENCPSEESIALLKKHASENQDEQLRSIAIQSLGIIMDRKALPLFEKLLKDSSQRIRVQSALALKKLGKVGVSVLKNQKEEQDKEAFRAATFALSLPDDYTESQSVKWYRYY